MPKSYFNSVRIFCEYLKERMDFPEDGLDDWELDDPVLSDSDYGTKFTGYLHDPSKDVYYEVSYLSTQDGYEDFTLDPRPLKRSQQVVTVIKNTYS